jgi:hypothetical protein
VVALNFGSDLFVALHAFECRSLGGNLVALDTVAAAIQVLVRPGKGAGRDLGVSRPWETENGRQDTRPNQKSGPANYARYS